MARVGLLALSVGQTGFVFDRRTRLFFTFCFLKSHLGALSILIPFLAHLDPSRLYFETVPTQRAPFVIHAIVLYIPPKGNSFECTNIQKGGPAFFLANFSPILAIFHFGVSCIFGPIYAGHFCQFLLNFTDLGHFIFGIIGALKGISLFWGIDTTIA